MMGWAGSPLTRVIRPSSTWLSMPQLSGQSFGQTDLTILAAIPAHFSAISRPFYRVVESTQSALIFWPVCRKTPSGQDVPTGLGSPATETQIAKQDSMTDTEFEAPITRIEKIKTYARSRDGWTMILAFAIAVVSSIFMAGLLPVEDDMSAFGVVFIYFVTMIIIAGLIRMAMKIYDKFSKSSSS